MQTNQCQVHTPTTPFIHLSHTASCLNHLGPGTEQLETTPLAQSPLTSPTQPVLRCFPCPALSFLQKPPERLWPRFPPSHSSCSCPDLVLPHVACVAWRPLLLETIRNKFFQWHWALCKLKPPHKLMSHRYIWRQQAILQVAPPAPVEPSANVLTMTLPETLGSQNLPAKLLPDS